MKKISLLPNIITAFGLSCGLFVIFKINMTGIGDVTEKILMATAGILILAAIADLLDGALARAMKAESDFGGLFDTLADSITFGVAPSVVILKTLSISPGTELSFFMSAAAMIYTVCAVLRLIRYSITAMQTDNSDDLTTSVQKNFIGLPSPAAAGAAISMNLLLVSPELNGIITLDQFSRSSILFVVLIFLGYLMISRWRFPSLKTLRVRVASFHVVIATVITAVFIFYGIFHHFAIVLFVVCWSYLLTSLVLSLVRITTGKKSKTLEDFEPQDLDVEE